MATVNPTPHQLTIFYDGACPLCAAEMDKLRKLNQDGRLVFEDLQHPDFSRRFAHIDTDKANRILTAETDQGQLLYGLDVTYVAWQLAGHRWLSAPLGWPVLRVLLDPMYLLFARHRYKISKWLTGQERCSGYCEKR